jgi:ABC-2 type transport system permease protein
VTQHALRDYVLLSRIQLLELRTWGPITLIFTTLFPIAMILGFGVIGGGVAASGFIYVVTGAAVVSLVTIGITGTAQDLGEMQRNGDFQYYASLPISKAALLGAIITVRVLSVLPGLALTLVIGAARYGTPSDVNVGTLVLLPLTALALAGVGAAIGLLIRDFRVVATLSQLSLIVVMFASPVLIPLDALPAALQWASYALPPTYAADGLRHSLSADLDARFMLDTAVLTACATASLAAAGRWMSWRAA